MKANYHTHTWRCHHAEGTEREYIEKAIEAGMEILGFSDHAPYPYPEGYVADYKMLPSGLEDYVNTILDLKREYRGQIDIRLGMEAEYYPAMWERFLSLVEPYPIEYLLLGQHFLGNEYDDPVYCARETGSEKRLHRYCAQCMEALETGRFVYLAHPDLINFTGDDRAYEREMTQLCRYCREHGIPVEMNLLGIRMNRHYPDGRFWHIAAKEGCSVILGSDAHRPEDVDCPEAVQRAESILKKCGFSEGNGRSHGYSVTVSVDH